MSKADIALAKLAVRETIEDYLNFLDAKDWEGIASCFSDDAKSWYNFEPQVLEGGSGVAHWLRARVGPYGATAFDLEAAIDGGGHPWSAFRALRALFACVRL